MHLLVYKASHGCRCQYAPNERVSCHLRCRSRPCMAVEHDRISKGEMGNAQIPRGVVGGCVPPHNSGNKLLLPLLCLTQKQVPLEVGRPRVGKGTAGVGVNSPNFSFLTIVSFHTYQGMHARAVGVLQGARGAYATVAGSDGSGTPVDGTVGGYSCCCSPLLPGAPVLTAVQPLPASRLPSARRCL